MPEQGLTIFRNGAQVSTAFQGVQLPTARLDSGVGAGFGRVTYKGGKWGIKFQGEHKLLPYTMPDGTTIPTPYLDIVILQSSGHPSKAWYEGVYNEGDSGPPDCWSTDGHKPDASAPKRQSPTCLGCPHNSWGSKINRETGVATRGKACMDMKRLAVVPVGDIENRGMGGPIMLSVPPSSLKRLGPYQNQLEHAGFNYCQVWTRVTFVPNVAYPMFDFDAVAALNDIQAAQVVKMLTHPLIERILNTELAQVEAWDESAQAVHAGIQPHAQPQANGAAQPAQAAAQPQPQPQPTPAPQPTQPAPQPAPQPQPTPAPAPQPTPAPQQDLSPPAFLDRRQEAAQVPTTAPAAAVQEAQPGLPDQPPPGVDPAQWAQFLAMQRGSAPPRKARAKPPAQTGVRTPPVSPQPTDSAAVAAAQQTMNLQPPPEPVPMAVTFSSAPPAQPAQIGQTMPNSAVLDKLQSTINELV